MRRGEATGLRGRPDQWSRAGGGRGKGRWHTLSALQRNLLIKRLFLIQLRKCQCHGSRTCTREACDRAQGPGCVRRPPTWSWGDSGSAPAARWVPLVLRLRERRTDHYTRGTSSPTGETEANANGLCLRGPGEGHPGQKAAGGVVAGESGTPSERRVMNRGLRE